MHFHEEMNEKKLFRATTFSFLLISLLVYVGCNNRNGENNLPAAPDTVPPDIVSTSPGKNADGVDLNTTVIITFSEPMNPSTINASTINVVDWDNNPISGTIQYQGTTATFTPSKDLSMHSGYQVYVMKDVADLAGNTLGCDFWTSFWTTGEPSHLFLPVEAKSVGSWPEAVAIADMNGDGRSDVVMVTSFGNDPSNDFCIFVFFQNGAGGLDAPVKYTTSGTSQYPPKTLAIGDINGDGKPDVVVGHSGLNSSLNSIEVFLQNGSGGLGVGILYPTVNSDKIRIADLNNDGRLDIVGIGWGSNSADVFLQKVDGSLQSSTTYPITHNGFMYDDLAVGDVNNDGLTDIVVMSEYFADQNIGVLQQKPGGGFYGPVYYDIGLIGYDYEYPSSVEVGDVNGDSLPDIVLSYGGNWPTSNIGVFHQNNTGLLTLPVSYPSYDCPEAVGIDDVNEDGRNDVVVAHGGWFALGVYLQAADGTLSSEELYYLPYASRYNSQGLAIGDVNDDGRNDVVVADYNHGLLILYHR